MSRKRKSSKNLSNFLSNIDEMILEYRYFIFILLLGIIFILVGFTIYKTYNFEKDSVEIINDDKSTTSIVVEIAGEVIKPGVYKLDEGSRVDDLIVLAGGINANADRNWMDKNLNKASKLTDGQKLYIPNVNEQLNVLSASSDNGYQNISSNISNQGSGFIDINTATQKELESLNGIGQVYAQKIIEHRPYSNTQEIVSKAQIPQKTFEKIKDQIIVY
jgi:competence protein ComEA